MQDVESSEELAPADANPARPEANVQAAKAARAPSVARRLVPIALILAAVAALGLGYYAWQRWFGGDGATDNLLIAVATRGDLEDTITATGTLQPKDFVDVGTQVSGQLKKLHVDVGDVVEKGQLLAEIDPSVYQAKVDGDHAQLGNQQAQLADKQAQLALADLQLTRQQNMMRENATSADALQSAEATRKSAQAQQDSIKAQLQQTGSTLRADEANLGYTKIHAPIAGTVVSQAAKQGQTLNANQQAPIVMRIADLSTMTVEAQVSEADVPKLHVGMDVYFTTLGGDNRRFYGKLRQIPPTPNVVNNVVLYDALFDVANPDQALMTQMTAQVFFVAASAKDAVLVPLTALRPLGTSGRRHGPRTPGAGGGEDKGGTRGGSDERAPAAARGGSDERTPGAARGGADERVPVAARGAADERVPDAARGGSADRPPGAARTDRAGGADARSQFANRRALVSVVDAAGKITDREVKVGVVNRVSAQILSGLEPGERVVIGNKAPAAAARAPSNSALVPNPQRGGRGP